MAIGYVQRRVIPGYVYFEYDEYTPAANVTSLPIRIFRDGGTDGDFTIDVSYEDGTAIQGTDYTFTNTTVTIDDGSEGPATVTITLTPQYVSSKQFNLVLSDPFIGTIGMPDETSVTIEPLGSVALETNSLEVAQGGTVEIDVVRTVAYSGAISGNWSTDIAGATPSSGTYSFADGQSSPETISFALDDTDDDGAVTITLNPSDTNILVSPSTASIDVLRYGVVEFDSATYSFGGGITNDTLTVYVNRISGSDGAGSAVFAVTGGTAVEGVNYTISTASPATWTDGDDTAFAVEIDITADDYDDLTLELTLSSPSTVELGAVTTVTINIGAVYRYLSTSYINIAATAFKDTAIHGSGSTPGGTIGSVVTAATDRIIVSKPSIASDANLTWDAWSQYDDDTKPGGTNLSWGNRYNISDESDVALVGISPGQFATVAAALAGAQALLPKSYSGATEYQFWNQDTPIDDNRRGLSLKVERWEVNT